MHATLRLFVALGLAALAGAAESGLAAFLAQQGGQERGLALVLNDPDGRLCIGLARGGSLQVQGASSRREQADAARQVLAADPDRARLSYIWRRTAHLPYADDLLNLVVSGPPGTAGPDFAEILRVLRPGGVALVGADTGCDAAALAADAARVPLAAVERLTRPGWIRIAKQADPRHGAWTSARGGPDQSTVSDDRLVAPGRELRWIGTPVWAEMKGSYQGELLVGGRDFHEEMELVKPGLGAWTLICRDAFNGSEVWRQALGAAPGRSLCADAQRLYRIEDGQLIARSAVDGALARTYRPASIDTRATLINGVLLLRGEALDTASGEVRWKRPAIALPAAAGDKAFVLTKAGVEAVRIADGATLWTTPLPELVTTRLVMILCKAGRVFVPFVHADNKAQTLVALADDGRRLWTDTRPCGFEGLPVLPSSSQVAYGGLTSILLDAATGKELSVLAAKKSESRCWPAKGTERFLITQQSYFEDRASRELVMQDGVRSSCGNGAFFGNGLSYYLPHLCFCKVSLRGVVALSGSSRVPAGDSGPLLLPGTAQAAAFPASAPGDWPTYRSDQARSNRHGGPLPARLKQLWTAKVGSGPLAQVSAAGGLVFVPDIDGRRLVALDAATGTPRWSHAAQGRIPLPPTVHQGRLLFGDRDGWVTCLAAQDGAPLWRFQAAPEQRYLAGFGQLESVAPVASGVAVLAERAYLVAGRSGTMDRGLTLYALDPATGATAWSRPISDNLSADILTSDGKNLFLLRHLIDPADGRLKQIDPPKGMLRAGKSWQGLCSILDLLEVNRTPLHDHKAHLQDERSFGEMIAFDQVRTVVSRRYYKQWKMADFIPEDDMTMIVQCAGASTWTQRRCPQQFLGLVMAGERIYAAGRPAERDAALPPELWVLASADGAVAQKLPLPGIPAVDGLSAADGRLFVAGEDGSLTCFGAE